MIKENSYRLRIFSATLIVFLIVFLFHFINLNFMFNREGFTISDVFFYVLIIYTIVGIFSINQFKKSHKHYLNISFYKIYLSIYLFLLVLYFLTSFIQSIYLIDQTIYIIQEKIIQGNPLLYLNFSSVNYTTLTFVNSIFRGMNSPLMIFFMGLWIQYVLLTSYKLETIAEPELLKELLVYKFPIHYIWYVVTILSFISINLFELNYTLESLIEIVLTLIMFILSLMGSLLSTQWMKSSGYYMPLSRSTHLHMLAFLLNKAFIVITLIRIVYHYVLIYVFNMNRPIILSEILSLVVGLILMFFHYKLKKID